jgi:nitrogen regulatory protein PII
MKMVLLVYHAEYDDAIREIVERLRLPGFTEVQRVFGTGESGKRLGSHVFPGHGSLVFSVLSDEDVPRVTAAVRTFKASLGARHKRPGGVKLFVLPVEEMA